MVDEQGVSKGIRNVLEERGIKTSGIYGDDLRNMLSEQQDFKEDKKWTRLILKVNELGGDGAYAPKYHPELQIPIEQGWCDAKKKFKDMQDFKIKKTEEVMERINHCLDTIPVKALKKARNQHRTAPRV
eukprot:1028675_1